MTRTGKFIHILIVDDHKLLRSGLSKLIGGFDFPTLLSEASNGIEAIAILKKKHVDLMLLDIQMPQRGGVETLRQIRREKRATKVIVLTQFDEDALIIYLLQLGANGFLLKSCEPEELEKAIIAVLAEGHYYDERVLKAIESNLSKEVKLSQLNISPREFQVLVLLKDGMTTKEVAENLGLTLRTIETYRNALIKKTKCRNTADLISLAYRTGVLPR